MKIFFSYKREDEQLRDAIEKRLKEILPDNFKFWTDVRMLRWGSNFPEEIKEAIMSEVDFFICLVTDEADKSDWVLKELNLAKTREKTERHGFILPIVVKGTAKNNLWHALNLDETNYAEIDPDDYEQFEKQIYRIKDMLFHIICTEMEKYLHPSAESKLDNIRNNEEWLDSIADDVRREVFSHREGNPISVDELTARVKANHPDLDINSMPMIIEEMLKSRKLLGIDYDGEYMFLVEEHASWNNSFHQKQKEQIAKYVFNEYIKKPRARTVYVDSGSTSLELVKRICGYFKSPANNLELTVITPSTEHLQLLSETCVALGYANDSLDSERLRLVVPGGYIHSATQTIVQLNEENDNYISKVCDSCGFKIDVAFIGANGITVKNGIKTYSNKEDVWKRDAILNAAKTVIICDSAKFGVESKTLDAPVVNWDDDFTIVVNRDDKNPELTEAVKKYTEKIILTE
ncbi:MAG: TIR domain-containing protein [Clostridia bacterium]|nr:TIR domain-containing protein [Clostridia bacterium]